MPLHISRYEAGQPMTASKIVQPRGQSEELKCVPVLFLFERTSVNSSDAQGYECWERVKSWDYCSSKAVLHESLDFQTVWHGVTLSICRSHDMIQEVYQSVCTVLFSLASRIPRHLQKSMNSLENSRNILFTSKERSLEKF